MLRSGTPQSRQVGKAGRLSAGEDVDDGVPRVPALPGAVAAAAAESAP